jgi:hypothetical protein
MKNVIITRVMARRADRLKPWIYLPQEYGKSLRKLDMALVIFIMLERFFLPQLVKIRKICFGLSILHMD